MKNNSLQYSKIDQQDRVCSPFKHARKNHWKTTTYLFAKQRNKNGILKHRDEKLPPIPTVSKGHRLDNIKYIGQKICDYHSSKKNIGRINDSYRFAFRTSEGLLDGMRSRIKWRNLNWSVWYEKKSEFHSH